MHKQAQVEIGWLKRPSGIKGKRMLMHIVPLVEFIFNHGKNVMVVCSYPVKCSVLKIRH